MPTNLKRLTEYTNNFRGFGKVKKLEHPQTRSCKKCGQKYTINYPYENCNPRTRDLCDDCIYPEWPKI